MLATLGSGEVRGLGPLGAPVDEAVADDGAVRFHPCLKSAQDNLVPSEVQCFVYQAILTTSAKGVQEPRASSPRRLVDANGMPIRIPKLAVRNRIDESAGPVGEHPPTYTQSEGGSSGSATSLRSYQRVSTPSSSRTVSEENVPTRRSMGSQESQQGSKQAEKKKKRGMLGFLTLKEPSSSAWAEFAEAEKEKARQKGVETTEKSSMMKLPEDVPKVNSKWDGLPESAKRKSMDSKRVASSRGNRDSTLSTSTRPSNWTAITSASTGTRDSWRRFGHNPQTSRSTGRLSTQSSAPFSPYDYNVSSSEQPLPDYDLGPERQPIEESEENRPQTFLLPPSPELVGHDKIVLAGPPDPNSPLRTPELDADDTRYFHELNARLSSDTDEPAELPVMPATPPATGDADDPVLVGIHYPEMDSPSAERNTAAYDFGIADEKYDQQVDEEPPSTNSKRRTINFSRPRGLIIPRSHDMQPLSIDEITERPSPVEGLSPTLTNASGQIDPFPTETFAIHSRETGHIPNRVASTIDPSTRTAEKPVFSDLGDDDSDSDKSGKDEYPDEPDFSTGSQLHPQDDPAATPTRETYPTLDAGPERSGSQLSLTPSNAPSAMSESWNLSPKERLGLGSKVRKSAVLPWETDGFDDGQTVQSPSSPLVDSKRKRLSLRLSSRK